MPKFFFRNLLLTSFVFFIASCSGGKDKDDNINDEVIELTRFKGAYKSFDDLHDLHIAAAQEKGITPMQGRSDTLKYESEMVKLPAELDFYKMDRLTHSVPLLVEDASNLLVRIGLNFKDSLRSKNMPPYKIIVTSVTRTQDDVEALTKRNKNASENSPHRYGTTFDISWKRFEKLGPEGDDDVSPEKLKLVLAEVLHDLRQRKKCYITYERKQACFHITVR